MSRKPQAGACGKCGCAVVRPTDDELEPLLRHDDVWVKGHHYVLGELTEVRCFNHEEKQWNDGWS